MRSGILRKLTVLLIIVLPVFTVADCKKQAKCGCDGDVVRSLDREQAHVYFNENGSTIWFTLLSDPYSSYFYFCNPGEMFPKLADSQSGDILLVSGEAFWECNFLYQSSNYYYGASQKVYQVHVTNLIVDLYGKK